MMRLVECVPNFSEGRDPAVIEAIADAIRGVSGALLLDIDSGWDTNRTVMTFVGSPEAVGEAAFRAIAAAANLIDMRRHSGVHPRMGATDVCPFVPVSGVTEQDCVLLSQRVGERVGRELGIPVYLYAHSARVIERRALPDIRAGEYEALEHKLGQPQWRPDYGPASFNARAGVTAIGARDFMIAYNINLNTTDVGIAADIARTIRSRGRARRDQFGTLLRDGNGSVLTAPGRLVHCQARGWYIEQYGCAQVTMNLHRFQETGLERAFEVTSEEARTRGVRVTGSEIIGMVPLDALLQAGSHFLMKAGQSRGATERLIVGSAIASLGLDDKRPFVPDERIIEYRVTGERAG